MKIFKLHTGNEEARNLTRDNYKEAVLELPKEERENYSKSTENGRRYFAVCPACDNPTSEISKKIFMFCCGRTSTLQYI